MKPELYKKYYRGDRELTDLEFAECAKALKKDAMMFEQQIKRNYFVKRIVLSSIDASSRTKVEPQISFLNTLNV